jgi:hypothetical protein
MEEWKHRMGRLGGMEALVEEAGRVAGWGRNGGREEWRQLAGWGQLGGPGIDIAGCVLASSLVVV